MRSSALAISISLTHCFTTVEKKIKTFKYKGDGVIWAVFLILCLISVVEVFSASSGLSFKSGNYISPVLKHCGLLCFGIVCMLCVMNIKCRLFKLVTPFALFIAFLMLIFAFLYGESTNDANRWISIMGIQLQPSEFAKGALVMGVAQILSAMQTEAGADRKAFKYILIVCAFMIVPVMPENLSTAGIMCLVVLMMMFIGRVPNAQIGRLLGVTFLILITAVAAIETLGDDTKSKEPQSDKVAMVEQIDNNSDEGVADKVLHRLGTWKARINKFMDNREVAPEEVDLDKDAQVAHANIAIASSNIIGKGPGNSVERDFLSQAFSDFIYAIIIEEMGIGGAIVVCFLYIILLFRTAKIANRCVNAFPALLIMGLAFMIVLQAMFNMAVAVGLVPVTGQPLPLISKGGTSSIVNCVYVGMILSVSHSAKKKDDTPEKIAAAGIELDPDDL